MHTEDSRLQSNVLVVICVWYSICPCNPVSLHGLQIMYVHPSLLFSLLRRVADIRNGRQHRFAVQLRAVRATDWRERKEVWRQRWGGSLGAGGGSGVPLLGWE